MLLLSDSDVKKLLSMREAIDVVERAFGEYVKGSVLMPLRTTVNIDGFEGSMVLMPSYLRESNIFATKIVSVFSQNPKLGLPTTIAWIAVNDPKTGVLKALIESTYLTAVRTGAATGVAARYLAPKNSRIAAIIGCGEQGRTQAWAIAETLELDSINVYDLLKERVKRFVNDMEERLCVDLISADNCYDAVKDADVVITATTSKEPAVIREWIGEEVHLSSIGSFQPDTRELDTGIIRDAKVVVDSREAALQEAGDLIIPIKEGVITEDHIYAELGELVLSRKKGRVKGDGLTVFKSVGLALQDSSVANLVLKKWLETLGSRD